MVDVVSGLRDVAANLVQCAEFSNGSDRALSRSAAGLRDPRHGRRSGTSSTGGGMKS